MALTLNFFLIFDSQIRIIEFFIKNEFSWPFVISVRFRISSGIMFSKSAFKIICNTGIK